MDKKSAMARLDAIECEARQLRELIAGPKWKPEQLIGKLCWVWDNPEHKRSALVTGYNSSLNYPYEIHGSRWLYAEPISCETIRNMTFNPEESEV